MRRYFRATGTLGLLAAAVSFSPAPGVSQAPEPEGDSHPGRGFFQVGYVGLDLGALNATLEAAAYPALDGNFLTLGGGGYGTHGRLLIGGEGHGLIGSDATTTDGVSKLSIDGGYGLFRLGYLVIADDQLDVFPLLGIGGGGMSLKIVERGAPIFDDILTDPRRSSDLATSMFLMDLAIGAHYRLSTSGPDDEGDGGLLVGLQAGYVFAPGDPSWTLDEINTVAGGPRLAIEGAYVRLTVGGWGGR